ncbi:MAG TPA: cytidine deaminase [Planktothrix sp.]|jgi:cytidine deaminase
MTKTTAKSQVIATATPIKTFTSHKPQIVLPELIKVHPRDRKRYRALIDQAKEASARAYCPYSKFNVGAAALTFDGLVYTGCNVENCGYTQTKHAEEVAVTGAVNDGLLVRAKAAGLTQFQALLAVAVFAPKGSDPWPCCNCRQFLGDFGYDMHIIGYDNQITDQGAHDEILCLTLGQLVPHPFPIEEVLASVNG